jgi:hypothetical protein
VLVVLNEVHFLHTSSIFSAVTHAISNASFGFRPFPHKPLPLTKKSSVYNLREANLASSSRIVWGTFRHFVFLSEDALLF